ncbi:hypothetical protein [Paraburkholderia tropica]|uniref:hypothetical protein n=1 Tax=Paraburkholderia tropica TaxID=92647 RepID=UPI002AB775AB|nr:hypothetical protein [Paraburkholderia tropica]
MNFMRKRRAFADRLCIIAAIPLVLAACSKQATNATNAAEPAPASTVQQSSPVAAASNQPPVASSSVAPVSMPTVSASSAESRDAGADAQEADESGAAVGTVMVSDTGGDQSAKTPFGKLSTNDSNVLLLDGKPVSPQIQGNNSLSFVAQVAMKNRRAVLVQDNGGTACPALYHWVILSEGSYTVGPEFGSCSDLPKVSTESGKLIVTMPDFVGDAASEAEQKRVAKRTKKYVYNGKAMTENGKPLTGG